MEIKKLINELKKNRLFYGLILLIFILHLITFPSIHHMGDEQLWLDIGKQVCEGNFTAFFSDVGDFSAHTPFYHLLLCASSPIHNFNLERAEIVAFIFLIFTIIGWYFSFPEKLKIDKKKFTLLLFSNSLLWIYSLRVLMDVPLAFFLSLGMFQLFLFFEYEKKKNYYISFILLSLALLIKESAIAFFPIFFIYLFFVKKLNVKNFILLLLPFVPYMFFILYQYLSNYQVLWVFKVVFKVAGVDFSFIPYANLPTAFYMIGTFGLGFLSCILMWKKIGKEKVLNNFLMFSLILYLVWEIVYDFVLWANLPRYHTTLIPFLTLLISEGSKKSKKMRYLYYLTLIFTLFSGFFISYYFHTSSIEIWKKYSFLIDLIRKLRS